MIFKRWWGNDPFRLGEPPMPPLHWWPTKGYLSEHGMVAIITCKNGHACSLNIKPRPNHPGHSLSADGVMFPSLGCPTPGCDGHEMPGSVLEGWNGGSFPVSQPPKVSKVSSWNWVEHA